MDKSFEHIIQFKQQVFCDICMTALGHPWLNQITCNQSALCLLNIPIATSKLNFKFFPSLGKRSSMRLYRLVSESDKLINLINILASFYRALTRSILDMDPDPAPWKLICLICNEIPPYINMNGSFQHIFHLKQHVFPDICTTALDHPWLNQITGSQSALRLLKFPVATSKYNCQLFLSLGKRSSLRLYWFVSQLDKLINLLNQYFGQLFQSFDQIYKVLGMDPDTAPW